MTGTTPYTFVSFASSPWCDIWQTWQYITWRMAREHRVLFCSHVPSWLEVLHRVRIRDPIRWRAKRLSNSLTDMPAWPWLPRVPEWPDLDRFLQKMHTARLRASLNRRGWDNRILYIWHPEMADMVGRFDERLVCFHVYDDYTSYTHLTDEERRTVVGQTARLLERADLVFAAGTAMRATLDRDDVHVVPNAVDYPLFAGAAALDEPPPPDMAKIPKPILAHIGRLNVKIDYGLLAEIARRRPDWSVAVLGPFTGFFPPKEHAERTAFLAQPNAFHIPAKPAAELPRYLRHLDVALMAYRPVGWVQTISPIKLFEYTAAGRPIVAADIQEVRRYPDYVTIAQTPDEWVAAIEYWLANDSEALVRKRMALARENSWDARCEQILGLIGQRLEG